MRKIEYDYELQVWVIDGVIPDCEHPENHPNLRKPYCCNMRRYAGMQVDAVRLLVKAEKNLKRVNPHPSR